MLAHDSGVLSATTAFGKTVIGAWLIAQRRVNTLVLVHRRQLQDQWIERLSTFLGVPRDAIGRVGGGIRRPTGAIDVAIVQSLVRRGAVKESVRHYGQPSWMNAIISPHNFERVAREARAKFILGLSARQCARTASIRSCSCSAARCASRRRQASGGRPSFFAYRNRASHRLPVSKSGRSRRPHSIPGSLR